VKAKLLQGEEVYNSLKDTFTIPTHLRNETKSDICGELELEPEKGEDMLPLFEV